MPSSFRLIIIDHYTKVIKAAAHSTTPRALLCFIPMRRLEVLGLCILVIVIPSDAQAPSASTLDLSLRTMSKALDSCRIAYTRVFPGAREPLVKRIIGEADYKLDLLALSRADSIAKGLISRPSSMSGRALVALVSSSDDFSVGVSTSRTEIIRHMALDTKASQSEMLVSAEALNDCQKSLFNAGDDFVGLVLNYVGAEDEQLAARTKRK